MSIELIEIFIKNQKRTLISAGTGQHICHIVGPGSFYLKPLIYAGLAEKFTFTACDPFWIDNDLNVGPDSLIDIIAYEHELIQKIKIRFQRSKIGMLGFSAPASVATHYAMQYPEDIAWLKLVGIPMQGSHSDFSDSNELFQKNATKDRVQNFSLDQKNLFNNSFYTYLSRYYALNQEGTSAHFKWLQETIAIYHKAFYCDVFQYKYAFFEHWKDNILGQEMNQDFRQHFFDSILSKVDVFSNIVGLSKKVSIQIFNGEEDYVTPMSSEIKEAIFNIPSIQLINYPRCGHCPYIENSQNFFNDMLGCIDI